MVVELAKQQTKAGVKEGVEEKAIIRTLYSSQVVKTWEYSTQQKEEN